MLVMGRGVDTSAFGTPTVSAGNWGPFWHFCNHRRTPQRPGISVPGLV
jgi:hypothetical protein